jgi:signal transduction histidine kinase
MSASIVPERPRPGGPWREAWRNLHRRWAAQQNLAEIHEAFGPTSWLLTLLFMAVIVALGAWGPMTRDFFGLDPGLPLAHLAVSAGLFLVAGPLVRRAASLTPRVTALIVLTGFNFDLFLLALVVSAQGFGAITFGCLYLFVKTQSGQVYRTTLRAPLMLAGDVFGPWLLSLLLRPDADMALLVFFVPVGLASQVLAGMRSRRADIARAESERLRSALAASQLSEDQARLSARLIDVLSSNHDLRNSVNTAMLSVGLLRTEVQAGAPDERGAKARKWVDLLETSLQRVVSIVNSEKRAGEAGGAPRSPEPVDVAAVLGEVRAAIHRVRPGTAITVDTPPAPVGVLVVGGRISLHRALENLVLNACEGDGVRSASAVRVSVGAADEAGWVRIVVRDDGPGFTPEQLARPIRSFETSKPRGTGLGLFTSERVILASGGALERRNAPAGGAEVELLLSVAKPEVAAPLRSA